MMPQPTLATAGFERYTKTTRRSAFLSEMDQVVPWRELCALVDPVYPKPGNWAAPIGSSACCASISCSSGSICPIPGSKRRSMSLSMRRFVGRDLRA
jgi:transposase, IS5 family